MTILDQFAQEKFDKILKILCKKDETFDYQKAAIKWQIVASDCIYWDAKNWSKNNEANEAIITYDKLVDMIDIVSNVLQNKLSDWSSTSQPVISISIPEGCYLPIATLSILATNMLHTDAGKAAVMLPLDPDEGKDRLVHMIIDAKPSIILCARELDEEKLKDAVKSAQARDVDYQPIVYNLQEILSDGMNLPASISNLDSTYMNNRISHIVYTSGTTGNPKGCISSLSSLLYYIHAKNTAHGITEASNVFLASALPFDPCLSDVIATFFANATLCISSRQVMQNSLASVLINLEATHILCTPSLWSGVEGETKGVLGKLEVVALGGEMIPASIRRFWGRRKASLEDESCRNIKNGNIKLFCTYGVTEACVYQTITEVFCDDPVPAKGQEIGLPLDGMNVEIWREQQDDSNLTPEVLAPMKLGEIVLVGRQLDSYSGYLNLPKITQERFVEVDGKFYYRTGDQGQLSTCGRLEILGRICGEEGQIKINGIRVELGEIEHAIVEQSVEGFEIVKSCVVQVETFDEGERKKLIAYCVLSTKCNRELGLKSFPKEGLIVGPSPLLSYFRAKASKRVRKACIPSTFILIEKVPLTRTGKIARNTLPLAEACISLQDALVATDEETIHLSSYKRCGKFVAREIAECLNLQPSQIKMITTTSSFAMLGGDSLAATRIVRALYALHHNLNNSRQLGGEYGSLGGAFDALYLIRSANLGEYVDFLDSSGVLDESQEQIKDFEDIVEKPDFSNDTAKELYDALVQAVTMDQTMIAIGLLQEGADPNHNQNNKRLGKTKGGRTEVKESFSSGPVHLACLKGNLELVEALIKIGKCNVKRPDAAGSYPLHLACSGLGQGIQSNTHYDEAEDKNRLEIVKILLRENVPLAMKNSTKQNCLHCATRGGYVLLLEFLLEQWKNDDKIKAVKQWGEKVDWQDRWFRSPVHWAVLHGNVKVLEILLKAGCSPNPPKPRRSPDSRTSGKVEFPIETCQRLYEGTEIGDQINTLLNRYMDTST